MRVLCALLLTKLLAVKATHEANSVGDELFDPRSLRGGQMESEMMGDDLDALDGLLEKHRKLGAYDDPQYIGCYADTWDRALPMYVDRGMDLDTCKRECTNMGSSLFGMQSWGECWCGSTGFSKHGRTKGCECDSKNIGSWKQCVYLINDYVGCYNDDNALPYLVGEGYTKNSCTKACRMQGYHFMGLNDDVCRCGGDSPIDVNYAEYGEAASCDCEAGSAGSNANCVHRVTQSTFRGCWSDDEDRALPHFAGKGLTVSECFDACQSEGYTLMGRQAHKECWCGGEKWYDLSFKKHGVSTGCLCHNSFIGHWKQCIYRVPNRDENGKIEK